MRFANRSNIMLIAGLLLIGGITPMAAQARPGQRTQQIRQRIEQVFMQRLATELRLTSDQSQQLGVLLADWGERRQGLETEEQQLRKGIADQLRPGVAAESDSVSLMVDRLLANRVAYAQSFEGEMASLGEVLSPVQRGQFLLLRDQLLRRARDLMAERPAQPGRQ
jgi:hypothetical protein